MRVIITKLLFALVVIALPWAGVAGLNTTDRQSLADGAALALWFQPNKTTLDEPSKLRLENALNGFFPLPSEKLLVVGFADSTGSDGDNIRLSQNRAEAVRMEILRRMGYPPQSILAVGRGEENPLSDNRTTSGRAKNRRVEIYLARAIDNHLEKRAKIRQPDLSAVETFIDEARAMVRQRDLQQAVQALNKAKAEGGENVGSWHAVSGITAFYAGRPADVVKSHLTQALALDPHNQEAHDFLGRIEARQQFAEGKIISTMGQTADAPIVVSSREQEHEFLRLFHIQAEKRTRIEENHLDVWVGADENGNKISYYFDYTGGMDRIFAPLEMSLPAKNQDVDGINQMESPNNLPKKELQVQRMEGQKADPGKRQASAAENVWESRVYR